MNEMTAGTPSQKTSAFAPMKKTGSAYNDAQQQKKKKMGITIDSVSQRYGTDVGNTYSAVIQSRDKNKSYTLTSDEIRGVRNLYKQAWNDYYDQDDEDQWNKMNGVMPRSFANGYKKGDESLYELGLPSSKYIDKYLEAYRSAKEEQKQLEDNYKLKNIRLNDFYNAVGKKWLNDETERGAYNSDYIFQNKDEQGNVLSQETWNARRQNQFFETLEQPEWADVRAMYAAGKKSAKDQSEYETPREYYEAMYKAELQNKEFTEEQQQKNIYNVSFSYDDFERIYNDNLRNYYTKQKYVDDVTVEDYINYAGNVQKVAAFQTDMEKYVNSYSGDYVDMIRDLKSGGASEEDLENAKRIALVAMRNKDTSNKEWKEQSKAFREGYDAVVTNQDLVQNQRLSKVTGEPLPEIEKWVDAKIGDNANRKEAYQDIFVQMREEGYTDEDIKKARGYLSTVPKYAWNRYGINQEYYHNYDGGIQHFARKIANGYDIDGMTSSMSSQDVLERVAAIGNSGALNQATLNDALVEFRNAHVSGAVLREAVNRYLSAQDANPLMGNSGNPRDISQYITPENEEALKSLGYSSKYITGSDRQKLRETLNAFVDNYERDDRGAIIEIARDKMLQNGYKNFDVDQAFSAVGWQDSIPIDVRAMDYYVSVGHAQDVIGGDDKDEAIRYFKMSEDEREDQCMADWFAMSEEERNAYIERFDLEKDFNPILNKSYEQQITQQFVGAWAKVVVGMLTSAANIADMASQWNQALVRRASAEFVSKMDNEEYEEILAKRQASLAELRKTNAAIQMYGKTNGQDGISNLISIGSDVFSEILRMQTMNFIGGGVANGILKAAGVSGGMAAVADGSANISKGFARLCKVASSVPFISDATANYWGEAMQQEGVSTGDATAYALICGLLEGGVEAINANNIFNRMLGGGKLADKLLRSGRVALTSDFTTKCKIIGLISNALGEGAEEGISYLASLILGNFTIRKNQFDTRPQSLKQGWEQAWDGFSLGEFGSEMGMGALVGLVADGFAGGADSYSPKALIVEEMERRGISMTNAQVLNGLEVIESLDSNSLQDYIAHMKPEDLMSDKALQEKMEQRQTAQEQVKAMQEQYDATIKNHEATIKRETRNVRNYTTQRDNAMRTNDLKKLERITNTLTTHQNALAKAKSDLANNQAKWQDTVRNQINPLQSQFLVADDAINRHWVAYTSAMDTYMEAMSNNKRLSERQTALVDNYNNAEADYNAKKEKTPDDLNSYVDAVAGMAEADDEIAPEIAGTEETLRQGDETSAAIREDGAEGMAAVAQARAENANAQDAAVAEQVIENQQEQQEQPEQAEQRRVPPQSEPVNGTFDFGVSAEQMRDENIKDGRTELNTEERTNVEDFAKRFGSTGVVWETMPVGYNGYFSNDGKIHLNVFQKGANGASYVEVTKIKFVHELTHSLESTKSYGVLQNLVKRAICDRYNIPEANYESDYVIPRFLNGYAEKGVTLTLSGARREAVAHFMEENSLGNDKTVKDFANFVARQNGGLAGHIFNGISNMLSRIGKGETAGHKLLYNSQKTWAKALKENKVDMRNSVQFSNGGNQFSTDLDATFDDSSSYVNPDAPLKKLSKGTYQTSNGGIAVQFSLDYAPKTDADVNKEVSRLVDSGAAVNEEEARRWVNSQTSLAALTAMDMLDSGMLDYAADDRYSAIKDNSDYPQGTIDFINDCVKRRPFSKLLAEVQRRYPTRVFDSTDLEAIRLILQNHGFPVGCVMCYVDDRRQNMGEIAQTFIDILNGSVPADFNMNASRQKLFAKLKEAGVTKVPNIADLVNYADFKKLHDSADFQDRAIYDAFLKFNGTYGMRSARLVEGDAEYKREILKWNSDKVKKVNDLGGLRIFSFSDFEAHHLLDIVQIVQDCAEKGVMIQGYTKVPAFAKAMADTGMKVNRSHISKGRGYHVDANGNYYINHDVKRDASGNIINYGDIDIDVREGIDPSDPDFIKSNGNIGNNIIGNSWEHIKAAMADPYFDQIIPFHTGLKEERLVQKGIDHWVNFKYAQTEKDASTFEKKADGKYNYKISDYQINFYTDVIQAAEEEGHPIKNAREFGEKFLEVAEEHGVIPRFWEALDEYRDEDGKLHYKYVPGYEKLLVDYPMFDANGNYLPQQVVAPVFDDEYNSSVLTKYIESESQKTSPEYIAEQNAIIDDIIENVVNGDPSAITNASGMQFSVDLDDKWESLGRQFGTFDNRNGRMRDANTPKQRTATQKTSQYFDNYLQNAKLSDDLIEESRKAFIEDGTGTYRVTHLDDLVQEARSEIAGEGYEVAVDKMLTSLDYSRLTPKLSVKGQQLLADAIEKGDKENVIKLAAKMSLVSAEAGALLNTFKVLRSLGGVGQAQYITMLVDRLNDKIYAKRIQEGKQPPFHLDQGLFDDLVAARDEKSVNNALNAIFYDLGQQVRPTLADGIRAWRYTAMLLNPVTWTRNMTGNGMMYALGMGSDILAAGLERAFVPKEQWTHSAKAIFNPRSDAFSAVRDAANESWATNKDYVQGSGKLSFENQVRRYARTANNDALNAVEKFSGDALEWQDARALKRAYVNSFTQYCVAQELDPSKMSKADMAKAVEHATNEAQRMTFRDPSWIASWLSQTSRMAAEKGWFAEMMVEGVFPFKKTPVNILRRGIEYSPIGLMQGAFDALVNVKKGKVTAGQAVNEIASGATGSFLFGLGMLLSRLGALRAHGDDDDKYEQFLEQTGEQDYALHLSLGGKEFSVALSQLAPSAIPLFMGASLAEGVDSETGLSVLTMLSNAANPMMEMSFLSSLNQALESYNGYGDNGSGLGALGAVGTSIAKSYASQFFPTIGAKVANVIDDTKRTSKGFKNSAVGDATWDSYLRGLERKVPGLENTLEESVDSLGRTTKKWTNFSEWLLNTANNFVLPANVSVIKRDEVDREIIDVFEMTGNTECLPVAPAKYITKTINGEQQKYNFTASEYTEYSKQYGNAMYSAIKSTMATNQYLNADWNERASLLKKAIDNAKTTISDMWKEEKFNGSSDVVPKDNVLIFDTSTGSTTLG